MHGARDLDRFHNGHGQTDEELLELIVDCTRQIDEVDDSALLIKCFYGENWTQGSIFEAIHPDRVRDAADWWSAFLADPLIH